MSGVDAPGGVVERIVGMRDELFDALQKTYDRLTSSATLPRLIYHFTDADGLIGIIQHRSLRGTLATALTDKSEMKVALEVAKGLIAARLKIKPTLFDRFFHTFIEKPAVFDAGKIPLRPGVISFCESAALSVHWTHYGRSGTGFALGFSPSKLAVGGLRVVKVIYGVEQQREVIRSLLAEASRVTLKTVQSMTKRGEIDHVLVKAAHMTAAFIKGSAALFKNEAFQYEREWRLTFFFDHEGGPSPDGYKFTGGYRSVNGRVCPFADLQYPKDRFPLKQIVIGYSSSTDKHDDEIQLLLEDGLGVEAASKVRVRRSTVPIRP